MLKIQHTNKLDARNFNEPISSERQNITFPSYSLLERTSGAIYAGVPTVDLGREWSKDDCIASKKHSNNYKSITIT